jgi:phosphoribosyl-AMP cyclohydrolase
MTDETTTFTPKYNDAGLMPVITVDDATGDVLMVAYANAEALQKTLTSGEAHYWSRSRAELWHKGATSGHTQKIIKVLTDCDQDTLIYRVEQQGAACHTGRKSCFYREIDSDNLGENIQLIFTDGS